ncbi:MAG: cytochrome C [Planctomycetota bacterium]
MSAQKMVDAFPGSAQSGCMACHGEIELIREADSEMMQQIVAIGSTRGDPAGCVVCHGGDPSETQDKSIAHGGDFYLDPGSPWVNDQTCGLSHPQHVEVQWRSLMMTEAGKIQGVCWSFGGLTGYEHTYGNYAVENPDDPEARLGSATYRAYMTRLSKLEPQVFVDRHEPLPDALGFDELERLNDDPTLAAFTYIRQECQRCHHAVKGRQKRGDFRGMGCSSCHVPYSNEGFYEGDDPTIDRNATGHMLVHSIQGTREAKVTVHDHTYSGIPVETCTTCHDRGKRIGVSFQGLMETPYESPYSADGDGQRALHTKHYIAMEQDIHYQKGMTCQDCHTSIDVHSDGFLAAANLAAVQIECSDCHGTPDAYPWDLPIGFMDEFEDVSATGAPRGLTDQLQSHTLQGTVYPPRDGYLLTARGNPYGNVVRDGNEVIVHTAAGTDIRMQPLKKLKDEKKLSQNGLVAMSGVATHLKEMECYSCHAAWAPQCYGCHVKIDFSQKDKCPEIDQSQTNFDWVAAGRRHMESEHAADRGETGYDTIIPGKITEQRSYLRWEEPMLGVNGEGRVTPLAPGCQPSVTIIGQDGEPIVTNHIYQVPEGAAETSGDGPLAIDMSPTQPHTMTKHARSCESCHASDKALGYGIDGGRSTRPLNETLVVDLETVDGTILSDRAQTQLEPIENMPDDWSRIVDEDGNVKQTIGHHFRLSRALNNDERRRMSRDGACLACHQEIPRQSLAVNLLHHVAKYTGQIPITAADHNSLIHKITLMSAWTQAIGIFGLPLGCAVTALWFRRRRIPKDVVHDDQTTDLSV